MVRAMAAIRPTQFSALKVLDHPYEKEERGEDHDGHADDEQVIHGDSWITTGGARHPERINQSPDQRGKLPSSRLPCGTAGLPNGPHASGQAGRGKPPAGTGAPGRP